MATTKASLISAINGFITAIIDITKHRNSMLELINIFFSTTIVKSNTPASNQFTYNLKFNKKGNMINVSGFIRNDYPIVKGNQNIFTQTDTELYAKTSQDTIDFGVLSPSNTNAMISFSANNIYLVDTIPSGASLYINSNYQTND